MKNELKPLILNPPMNITVIRDSLGLKKLQDFFQREKTIGWDIETNPLKDFYYRKCRTVQFGNQYEQYVVDLLHLCNEDSEKLSNSQGHYGKHVCPELQEFLETVKPVLCTNEWLKVGVSLQFEYMTFYWNFGLRTCNFYDCTTAEKCIYAGSHSLKDYSFYSMEEMAARYLLVQIEKELQESFTVCGELTEDQYKYAALDTRVPFGIKSAQELVIKGFTKKTSTSKVFDRIDPLVTGDNLEEIVQIENDCIGAFVDMHVHGERIDREKWNHRIAVTKIKLAETIAELDKIFLPIVGSKLDIITDQMVEEAKAKWKAFSIVPDDETQLKKQIRKEKNLIYQAQLAQQLNVKEITRKAQKEKLKKECSELGKRRTKLNNLVDKCDGDALINYSSGAQLLTVLTEMKGLKNLKSTGEDVLEQYEDFPVVKLILELRGLEKDVNTYGTSWTTEFVTHPCKEEGWLNPGDGRLHHTYNPQAAETGRSGSEKPNGQNVPKDEKGTPFEMQVRSCFIVDPPDEEYSEGYDLLTLDMSGAELRILAEEAQDPVWIESFNKDEDVHSICADLVDHEKWLALANPECEYFKLNSKGEPQRKKCKCSAHNSLRDAMKSTNFGLPYGIGPRKLSKQIKKTYQQTLEVLSKHRKAFPKIWEYLEKSGAKSKQQKKSFDMFGRRRLFPEPTWERAKEKSKEDREEELQFPIEVQKRNKENFINDNGRKPTSDELWYLTHREPNSNEIGNAINALIGSIERQGKNHRIQSANASILKIAMTTLWNELPKYGAWLLKMVHDELVIRTPKRYSEKVAEITQQAIRDAAARKMKLVVMESEYNIASYWKK